MKKTLMSFLIILSLAVTACSDNSEETSSVNEDGELEGEIDFWHSFTQGDRKEYLQEAADEFMEENPKVDINIETFSWEEFETKWTTGYSSGENPDVSTALPNHVVEMLDVEALEPLDDVIDDIGRDRFYEKALEEGEVDDKNYSIPLYSHAMVMWYREDLLEEVDEDVPETWNELFDVAKKVSEETDEYGLSVPMGSNDMLGTRFLNFYVRSAGETLITEDGKANLTSPEAIEGIKYWAKMFENTSPDGSVNYNALDQSDLFYNGNAAFDFNSGFHIGGIEENSPDLLEDIKAAPIPKIKKEDKRQGIETSNVPLVVWQNSDHPDIAKAFIETLYEDDDKYIDFLHSVPGGMLPVLEDISEKEEFLNNETIEEFDDSINVIEEAQEKGTAIGMEDGPKPEAGYITSQGIIEDMFQQIVLEDDSDEGIQKAAQNAEDQLNEVFESN